MEQTVAVPTDLWCCVRPAPYKARRTDHEEKFAAFLKWSTSGAPAPALLQSFVVQFAKNVNFGPVVFKRCFLFDPTSGVFREVGESRTMRLQELPVWDLRRRRLFLRAQPISRRG
jgi:hypothetical protein